MLYNRTSQKLKTRSRPNPPEQWVRTPEAFEGVIGPEQFAEAQQIFVRRRRKYLPDAMLAQLQLLEKRYGFLRSSLVRLLDDAPGAATFAHRFGGWDHAFQQLYHEPRDRARALVHERIRQQVPEVLPYADFLVLDQRLTVSVQPAVPMPRGYATYWPFRPDQRNVIDITLGVLLSDPGRVRDPRLRGAATLDGRLAAAARRGNLVADGIIRTS